MKNLLRAKQESHERYSARRLERYIVQFKANQELDEEKKNQMSQIEQDDPTLFEELSLKKKWSYVSKDPSRVLKDKSVSSAYWGELNSLPVKGVEKIVTDRILSYDKSTCERILGNILDEKKQEDFKKDVQRQDRH